MMYKKNVVACVKVGGQILREQSDRVTLPFGSEYSILLKNLDSVRIQARVHIDGYDTTGGNWLVIEPNGSFELERFIRNGNFDKGNRFKFIERTKPVENVRGIKADDGLVRIEYKKEFVAPKVVENIVRTKYVYDYDYWYRSWPYYKPYWFGDVTFTSTNGMQSGFSNTTSTFTSTNASNNQSFQNKMSQVNAGQDTVRCAAMNCTTHNLNDASLVNDAGITVPGSESNQTFVPVQNFAVESQTEVIVLHLVGTNEKATPVKKPITVLSKPKCVTCYKVNKATSRFCSQCGTALELI
jgi:hypothetical protein